MAPNKDGLSDVIATSFTKLVGVSAPIQLAAMPGISTPDLVAAVADAGGLGMLGAPLMSAAVLEARFWASSRSGRRASSGSTS